MNLALIRRNHEKVNSTGSATTMRSSDTEARHHFFAKCKKMIGGLPMLFTGIEN
jgi:hypothetical protein